MSSIDEESFSKHLYTAGMPDPDLLIGRAERSGSAIFFSGRLAYTEIYVTETLWPDFRREAYQDALKDYTGRKRRFGSLKEV